MTLLAQFLLIFLLSCTASTLASMTAYLIKYKWLNPVVYINVGTVIFWICLITLEGFNYTIKSTLIMACLIVFAVMLNILISFVIYILCHAIDKTKHMPPGKQNKIYSTISTVYTLSPFVWRKIKVMRVCVPLVAIVYLAVSNMVGDVHVSRNSTINEKFKYRVIYPAKMLTSKIKSIKA